MELHFDINRDGKISLEEEELGHQHPAEFDLISKIPNSFNSIMEISSKLLSHQQLEIFYGGFVYQSLI